MEVEDLEKVRESFERFHEYFSDLFGRSECRETGGDYARSLLVQSKDRRNAENLAEAIGASARTMQRFLTDAMWDDDAVTARLQEYLAWIFSDTEGFFVLDDSCFLKKGDKSAGVGRQYCGLTGQVENCQVGVFLSYITPGGRALIDKMLYLPESWTDDPGRCEAAGIRDERCLYRSKVEMGLELLKRAKLLGHMKSQWVAADDTYGRSAPFRKGVEGLGLYYVADVPKDTHVWPPKIRYEEPTGNSWKARPVREDMDVRDRAAQMPPEAWKRITVAEGSQGPREYLFACERMRDSRDKGPGEIVWALYRKNLDGDEPRYYLSNAPEDTPLETLAKVAGTRWPIETEIQTNKSDVGLDEYEVRSYQGWRRHITMCMLASAFLLTLQQEWGKKYAPDHSPAGLQVGARAVAEAALQPKGSDPTDGIDPGKESEGQIIAPETKRGAMFRG